MDIDITDRTIRLLALLPYDKLTAERTEQEFGAKGAKVKFIAPSHRAKAFNCPRCGVLTPQRWSYLYIDRDDTRPIARSGSYNNNDGYMLYGRITLSICSYCQNEAVWFDGQLFYPSVEGVEAPNPDLDEDIIVDYLEAASIVQQSVLVNGKVGHSMLKNPATPRMRTEAPPASRGRRLASPRFVAL
jgi:hypothetical protein